MEGVLICDPTYKVKLCNGTFGASWAVSEYQFL